jgi:hypothetical protein
MLFLDRDFGMKLLLGTEPDGERNGVTRETFHLAVSEEEAFSRFGCCSWDGRAAAHEGYRGLTPWTSDGIVSGPSDRAQVSGS